MNVHHPRVVCPVSTIELGPPSARRRSGILRTTALLVALLTTILVFAGQMSPPVDAQQPAPTPAASHQIYLPFVHQPLSVDAAAYGHGDWPAGRSYTVRDEDTLLSVALEMGMDLAQVSCLIAPDFNWERPLVIGDTLTVPDTPFTCHLVEDGESLADIAGLYGVTLDQIRAEGWNELNGEPRPGQNLRIPLAVTADLARGRLALEGDWGKTQNRERSVTSAPQPMPGEEDIPADWPYGSGTFAWPTYGWITQGFGIGHSAIDIGAFQGTAVTAADRGVVIRAGWSDVGYGQFVIIDHNIDYITLYAHLSEIYVEEGQIVGKGQMIGRVGSTGNSTGPHLHFEIRDFGTRVDPLTILPQ